MTFNGVCDKISVGLRGKWCLYDLLKVNLKEAVNCVLQYNISAADGSSHNKTLQNNRMEE